MLSLLRERLHARSAFTVLAVLSFLACAGTLFATPAAAATPDVYTSRFTGGESAEGSFYPNALAFNASGDVYVADPEHDVVDEYEASGGGKPQEFHLAFAPNGGIAVNAHGDLFIADGGEEKVVEFNSAGTEVATITGGKTAAGAFSPAGLAVNASGDLYVADPAHNVVDEFAEPSGSGEPVPIEKFSITGPEAVAVNSSGDLYVVSGTVVDEFNSTGTLVKEFTGSDTPQGSFGGYIFSIAIAPNGELYVSDGEYASTNPNGNYGVVDRYSTARSYVSQVEAGTEDPFTYLALAVSPSEVLYGGDTEHHTVDIFGSTSSTGPESQWTTLPATGETTTTAALNGTVNPEGHAVSACEFEYGTTSSYGHTILCAQSSGEIGEGTSPFHVSAEISGLEPATTYYFRVAGTGAKGPGHGDEKTLTTLVAVQGVKTGPYENVAINEATVTGSIEPDGAEIEYYFEYGTPTASGTRSATAIVTGTQGEKKTVTATLKALAGGTGYHYKLVAKNKLYAQLVSGAEEDFTTHQPIDVIEICAATEVTATSATLCGSLTPNTEKPEYDETEYYFEYSTGPLDGSGTKTTPVTITRAEVEANPNSRTVHASLTGLAAGSGATVYHYRLIAHDALGDSYSHLLEGTFATRPVFTSLTTEGATNVGPGGATLRGSFRPVGDSETTYWWEYAPCTGFGCVYKKTLEVTLSEAQIKTAEEGSHGGGVSVETAIGGLQTGGAYHDRLVAKSDSVTATAGESTFATGPEAPVVESESASEVAAAGALLTATIDPGNSTTSSYLTSYYFEYGRPGPGDVQAFAAAGQSASNGSVGIIPEKLTGLAPDSEYSYWLVAENASGKVEGPHQSFTTAVEPPAPAPPAAGGSPGSTSTGLSQSAAELLLPALAPVPIPKTTGAGTTPKPLTKAQKLVKALKTCRRDLKKTKRESCEKQARSKYGPLHNKGKPAKPKKAKK